jgi:hypothetical protein
MRECCRRPHTCRDGCRTIGWLAVIVGMSRCLGGEIAGDRGALSGAHCDVDWAGSESIKSQLDNAACKERGEPSADIFGKP